MTVEAQIAAYEQRLRELVPDVATSLRELPCEGGCGTLMRTYIDHPMCHPCRRKKPPKPKPERTEADRAAGRARYAAGYRQPGRSKLCAGGCGKLLSWSPARGSREQPTCQECRRAARQRICEQCGETFQSHRNSPAAGGGWIKFCTRRCWGLSRKKYDDPRAPRKAASRQRKAKRKLTWDGISDQQILDRDGWLCQIPGCADPLIDRNLVSPDPRSKSIDHIQHLSRGGDDTALNKRAAHLGCNVRRYNRED